MIPVIGLAVGIVLESCWSEAAHFLQPYLPIAIVAALDAMFVGPGVHRWRVQRPVFVVSFASNVLIAALIVWLGDQIGVGSQLSTAVVVVGASASSPMPPPSGERCSMPEYEKQSASEADAARTPPQSTRTPHPPAQYCRRPCGGVAPDADNFLRPDAVSSPRAGPGAGCARVVMQVRVQQSGRRTPPHAARSHPEVDGLAEETGA